MTTSERSKLVKKILGETYVSLDVLALIVDEDMYGQCCVKIQLHNLGVMSEGVGVGQVSATFDAFKKHFAPEFDSLQSIGLYDFRVKLSSGEGIDSQCTVDVRFKNSEGKVFEFTNTSRSLGASSARAICQAVEFFINSEKAFVALHRALSDARERGRDDLVTRYTAELAEVVKSTSYSQVIERIMRNEIR